MGQIKKELVMKLYMAHVGLWFLLWFFKFYFTSVYKYKKGMKVKFDLLAHTLIALLFGLASWSIHTGFFPIDCVCQ